MSFCFRIGLDLDGLILVLSFAIFWQTLLKWYTSKVLKIPVFLSDKNII